jgi:hypothetical protein
LPRIVKVPALTATLPAFPVLVDSEIMLEVSAIVSCPATLTNTLPPSLGPNVAAEIAPPLAMERVLAVTAMLGSPPLHGRSINANGYIREDPRSVDGELTSDTQQDTSANSSAEITNPDQTAIGERELPGCNRN